MDSKDSYYFKEQLETKDNLLKLKDEQVKTLENSLRLKDEQIKTLENSLQIKDEKAITLEKTINLKEEEISKLKSSALDPNLVKAKEKKIKKLEKEIEILNTELAKADEDLEHLELENEKLRTVKSDSSGAQIIDFTNIQINKSEILEKMRQILQNAISSVTIVVPSIEDLQELYLYEIKASTVLMIACAINPGIEEHSELLDEFESFDNITLRNYERRDRYALVRDGEELLIAVIGSSENNHLTFYTKDSKHIRLLNTLTTECWIQSRKI
ncbi:MAG: hypothetical protein ACFFD2_29695 [Promethearchaeota archaeon]